MAELLKNRVRMLVFLVDIKIHSLNYLQNAYLKLQFIITIFRNDYYFIGTEVWEVFVLYTQAHWTAYV